MPENKNYEEYAKKYPVQQELGMKNNKIEAMFKWCEKTEIQFTPTFFIDGFQLPEAYRIEDLEYFLLE
jgi:hypothetical protein